MVIVSGADAVELVFDLLCNLEIELHNKNESIPTEELKDEVIKKLYILDKENKKSLKRVLGIFEAAFKKFELFQCFLCENISVQELNFIINSYIQENQLKDTQVEKFILDALDRYKEFKRGNKHDYKI